MDQLYLYHSPRSQMEREAPAQEPMKLWRKDHKDSHPESQTSL